MIDKEEMRFASLEREYWDLSGKLDLFQYLIPINIAGEKRAFLNTLEKGEIYNPVFSYKKMMFDEKEIPKVLKKMKKEFMLLSRPLSECYEQIITDDIEFIINVSNRGSKQFPQWLSACYGYPSKDDSDFAYSILKQIKQNFSPKVEYTILPEVIKDEVEVSLRNLNLGGWGISLETSSARISVNPVTKKITIKEDALFHCDEIRRLLVHEIGVHVIRYENGLKQPFMLFSKGFPKYLETEEGLAIHSEKMNGLLSEIALTKYCCRLIAAHLCKYYDFCHIFNEIRSFLDDSDSFDVVSRIKRGLIETSEMGGFTKDQIYLTGMRKIETLEPTVIKKLFIGKIGIDDIQIIDKVELDYNVTYPRWLEE